MELSLLQSLLMGVLSGFAEILPVSAQAHRLIVLKLFGLDAEPLILRLMLHISTVVALHFYCRGHIVRMMRAFRLSRIPKRRRKRPLDTVSLMDFQLLKTAVIPVILAFVFYRKLEFLHSDLVFIAMLLAVNGVIMYIPQYLPGSNKESGAMSRIDSLVMGLGGALGSTGGISALGGAVSMATIRGMESVKALDLALILNIPVNLAFIVYDMADILGGGLTGLSFKMLVGAVLAAAAAAVCIIVACNLVKKIVKSVGICVFGFYSWAIAILTFVIYLLAA